MKKFYTLFTSIVITVSGMAQPVISNVELGIGDQFSLSANVFNGYYSAGAAGPEMNWDFSDLPNDSFFTFDYSVLEPSQADDFESFPDATSVWYRESGDAYMYEFLNFENNTKSFLGNVGVGLGEDIYLDDSNDIFTFPLSYLNTGNDTYTGVTYNPFMSEIQIEGTTSYAVDGYGTLETIFGVFPNVLRVTTVTEDVATTVLDIVTFTYSLNTSWYSTEHRVPLFTMNYSYFYEVENEMDTLYSDSTTVFTYLDLTSGLDVRKAENTFSIYPNPASDYIVLNADIDGKVPLKIYGSDGKLLLEKEVQEHSKIDISNLESGYYVAVLINDGARLKPTSFVVN